MTHFIWLAVASTAIVLSLIPLHREAPTKLIWNASASVPAGLYVVQSGQRLAVPDLVAVAPQEALASYLARYGYLPREAPLLKRVLGLPGQTVCRFGRSITVDAIVMGKALDRDRQGRMLPIWQGCRRILDDEIFLMNWEVQDSLDGRYFGVIPQHAIIGHAVPIWTDQDGSGRYTWQARPW